MVSNNIFFCRAGSKERISVPTAKLSITEYPCCTYARTCCITLSVRLSNCSYAVSLPFVKEIMVLTVHVKINGTRAIIIAILMILERMFFLEESVLFGTFPLIVSTPLQ